MQSSAAIYCILATNRWIRESSADMVSCGTPEGMTFPSERVDSFCFLRGRRRRFSSLPFLATRHQVGNVREEGFEGRPIFSTRQDATSPTSRSLLLVVIVVLGMAREDLPAQVAIPLAGANYQNEGSYQIPIADGGFGRFAEASVGRGQVVHHSHQEGVLGAVLEAEAGHELVGPGIVIDGSVQKEDLRGPERCKAPGCCRTRTTTVNFLVLVPGCLYW